MKGLYVHCPLRCVCVCTTYYIIMCWSVKTCDWSVWCQVRPVPSNNGRQQWGIVPISHHHMGSSTAQYYHTTITIVTLSCWALSVAHDDSSLSPSPWLLTVGATQHCSTTSLTQSLSRRYAPFISAVWSGRQYLLPCRLGDGLPTMIMVVARQSASQLCCRVCNIGNVGLIMFSNPANI